MTSATTTAGRTPRWLAAPLLLLAGTVAGACGSGSLDGASDDTVASSDAAPSSTDDRPIGDVCGELAEVERLGERYRVVSEQHVAAADAAVADASAAERDEILRLAFRQMVADVDPFLDELVDVYERAALAAPDDVASDLRTMSEFSVEFGESLTQVVERPDLEFEEVLGAMLTGHGETALAAAAATGRVNAFTVEQCGFEINPGA